MRDLVGLLKAAAEAIETLGQGGRAGRREDFSVYASRRLAVGPNGDERSQTAWVIRAKENMVRPPMEWPTTQARST